jgi:hypothetical protein
MYTHNIWLYLPYVNQRTNANDTDNKPKLFKMYQGETSTK